MGTTPTVAVLGAGAIGSFFGGLLAESLGRDRVILIGRGAHAEAIRNTGQISIAGGIVHKSVAVRLESDPRVLEQADWVLLTVKSHSTQEVLLQAGQYLGKATVVVIQNGICDSLLEGWLPRSQLVAGVTAINVRLAAPGRVELQLGGLTLLGPMFAEATGAARAATDLLSRSGMPVKFRSDIHGHRYAKLGMNAVGYVSCLSASNFIADCLLHPQWRKHVAIPLLEEIDRTYRAAGIRARAIPGRPGIRSFQTLCRILDFPVIGRATAVVMQKSFNRRPIVFSLYQDLIAGKKTEVDFINGEIVRLGEKHGEDCPLNRLVVHMVRELESRGPGMFFSLEEVICRFAGQHACFESHKPPLAL